MRLKKLKQVGPYGMSDVDIEDSRAPLMEHLIELRTRLMWSVAAIVLMFGVCFYFAEDIFNILLYPYERAAGDQENLKLIFTAPQEYFFTQLKLALFGAIFFAFPVIASQIYMFVAPGLYKQERGAFFPYLIATPVLFIAGGSLVYYVIMPLAFTFFLGMQQAGGDGQAAIELLPRVSEYLGLIMLLIFAFGLCFQLPVVLTLLARVGLVNAPQLRKGRKYAVVAVFAVAAVMTPPDIISQVGLALPTMILYEISIVAVMLIEKKRAAARDDDGSNMDTPDDGGETHPPAP